MDASERSLLEHAVRDAIQRATGAEAGAPATPVESIQAIDAALADLGWLEMLAIEAPDAVDVVFEALGALGAQASALDDVVVAALGLEPRADLAVLLPSFGSADPPVAVDGDRWSGAGLGTARLARADDVLVVAATPSGPRVSSVATASLEVHPVQGIDPAAGFHRVRVEQDALDAASLNWGAWDEAVAAGRLAVARQIAGASRAMLGFAREHALERVQFDRPIARFQAVRHRLAEALVAVEALDATIGAARDEPGATTAALAKAVAGRTARTVAAQCQQVLAGIGFTTDHPFHWFLKRTMALDGVFGTADAVTIELGRELLRTRRVPTLIEL
jgi:hypothetical protein